MPKAFLEIYFNLSLASVWEYISDLRNLGPCLRFVGEVEKYDGHIIWKVKAPMSITTRTSVLEAEYIQEEKNKLLSWRAKGNHLEWSGRFDLESLEEKKTKARIELEVLGLGPMAAIINPTAALQIKNQLKYFIEQLKKKLEGESLSLEGSGIPYCDEE